MIRRALSILEEGNKAQVVKEFKKWNESVLEDETFNSQIMSVNDIFDCNFVEKNLSITKRCYIKHLKDSKNQMILAALEEYGNQKESLMEMQEKNPSVKSLVDDFLLDVNNPLPF